MYESYEALLIERRGRVLVLTMNNPPLNPMTPRLHYELSTIFRDIQRDDETAVVVLTGADRGFSAGGNINSLIAGLDDQNRWQNGIREVREIIFGMLDLDKPIIGRINGHAMGLGSSLAVLCDKPFPRQDRAERARELRYITGARIVLGFLFPVGRQCFAQQVADPLPETALLLGPTKIHHSRFRSSTPAGAVCTLATEPKTSIMN